MNDDKLNNKNNSCKVAEDHNVAQPITSNKSETNQMKEDKRTKQELLAEIENRDQLILDLQIRLENSKTSSGRKTQVLELLRKNRSLSILDIAKELNISAKNVSSQLTYLRTDGYPIFTDPQGRKVLVETKPKVIVEDGSVTVSEEEV